MRIDQLYAEIFDFLYFPNFWVVAMETGNFLETLNDASLASSGF
jgi:hypothetical protein